MAKPIGFNLEKTLRVGIVRATPNLLSFFIFWELVSCQTDIPKKK